MLCVLCVLFVCFSGVLTAFIYRYVGLSAQVYECLPGVVVSLAVYWGGVLIENHAIHGKTVSVV